MARNLQKVLNGRGQQLHLDRFGMQKMILATDYNSVENIAMLRDQRSEMLNGLRDHPSRHFLLSRERHCAVSTEPANCQGQMVDLRLRSGANVGRLSECASRTCRTSPTTPDNATVPVEQQECGEADDNSGLRGSQQTDPVRPI